MHIFYQFKRSVDREIVKSRKLYFCDTGLVNILAEVSSGAQFENTLFYQIFKLGQIQYYALKTGQEIDFILGKNLAIEAKETPTETDLNYLKRIAFKAKVSSVKIIGRHQSPKFTNYTWAGPIT